VPFLNIIDETSKTKSLKVTEKPKASPRKCGKSKVNPNTPSMQKHSNSYRKQAAMENENSKRISAGKISVKQDITNHFMSMEKVKGQQMKPINTPEPQIMLSETSNFKEESSKIPPSRKWQMNSKSYFPKSRKVERSLDNSPPSPYYPGK
jgi:hypothetical protein